MTDEKLIRLLSEAYEQGYAKCCADLGVIKPYLSQNEAFKKYGKGLVLGWVKEGLITPIKEGANTSTVRYDRMKLDMVSKVNSGIFNN